MGTKLLILLTALSFLLAGPAFAVKRVPKSGDQSTEQRQSPAPDEQAPAPDKTTPPPERQGDRETEHSRPPQSEQSHRNGDRDRFIDRDGDGINDNLKKPPETIKKKRDNDRRDKDTENRNRDRRSRSTGR
jgi:hypothetical protein